MKLEGWVDTGESGAGAVGWPGDGHCACRTGPRVSAGDGVEVFAATLHGAAGFTRSVVLVELSGGPDGSDPDTARLIARAGLAARLHHPNVVALLAVERTAAGRLRVIAERVHGVGLDRVLEAGPLPVYACLHVVASILSGLDCAHTLLVRGQPSGLVHGALAPDRVLVSWGGEVKIGDFAGVTAAAGGDAWPRALRYASPEAIRGAALDGRADVYSAGVVLHELLTGRRMFSGSGPTDIAARVLRQPVAGPRAYRSEVTTALDTVCLRMLARDRRHRHADARQALDALLACAPADAPPGLDPRAALAGILARRFGDEAPPRIGAAPPPAASAALAAILPTPRDPPASSPDPSHPVISPSVARLMDRSTVTRRPRRDARPPRDTWWLVGAAVVCLAAITVTWLLFHGSGPALAR